MVCAMWDRERKNSQNGSSLSGEKRQDLCLDLEDKRKCGKWNGEKTRWAIQEDKLIWLNGEISSLNTPNILQ